MAKNYGYTAKIGIDTSGMAEGLKEIDGILKDTQKQLNETNRSIKKAEAAGTDSSEAVAEKIRLMSKLSETAYNKALQLGEISEKMKEALANGAIDEDVYREYVDELTKARAESALFEQQLKALREAHAQLNVELDESHTSAYINGLQDTSKAIDAEAERLKYLEQAVKNGIATEEEAAEYEQLRQSAIEKTTEHLEELRAKQEEVQQAFENGEISEEQYASFQQTLKKTSDEYSNLTAGEKEEEDQQKNNEKQTEETQKAYEKFEEKLKKAAKDGVKELLGVLKELGQEFEKIIVETAKYGDTVDKQSQRLGMTNEAYQEWRYILSQNGADISTLTAGMRTLTNQIDNLSKGAKAATQNFAKLGLSYEDMAGKTGEEQFSLVIERLQQIDDETQRNAIANDVLGRSYMQLIPLLNQSSGTVEELRQKAHDTNQILSDEGVDAAVDYTGAMDTLRKSFEGFKNEIGAQVLPGITEVIEGITDLLNGVDGAEERISKGVAQTLEDIENVIPKVGSLLGRIADAAGKKAPEIVTKMAAAIVSALPKISQAVKDMLPVILKAIEEILPDLGTAGSAIVMQIFNAIMDVISRPDEVGKLLNAFAEFGYNLCVGIADGIVNFDWTAFTNTLLTHIADVLSDADRHIKLTLDNMLGGNVYGGDINNVKESQWVKDYRDGAQIITEYHTEGIKQWREDYKEGKQILDEIFGHYEETADKVEDTVEKTEDAQKEIAESIAETFEPLETAAETADDAEKRIKDSLDRFKTDLEYLVETGEIDEAEANRRLINYLNTYLNADSELYKSEMTKALKDKKKIEQSITDEERKIYDQQVKDQQDIIDDRFRRLENQAKAEGKSNQWLYQQKQAVLEEYKKDGTLYEENRLKYEKELENLRANVDKEIREQKKKDHKDDLKKQWSAISKDDLEAQAEFLENLSIADKDLFDAYLEEYAKNVDDFEKAKTKELEDIAKQARSSAEKIENIYKQQTESITNAVKSGEIITDAKTGRERYIFTNYREKLRELKEYQRNLTRLQSMDIPQDMIKDIFSMDYKTRALYIKELLNMSAGNRQKYINDFTAFRQTAKAVGTQEGNYARGGEIKDIYAEDFTKLKDSAYQYGVDTIDEYVRGMTEEAKKRGLTLDSGYMAKIDSLRENTTAGNYTAVNEVVQKQSEQLGAVMNAVNEVIQKLNNGTININIDGKSICKSWWADAMNKSINVSDKGGVLT